MKYSREDGRGSSYAGTVLDSRRSEEEERWWTVFCCWLLLVKEAPDRPDSVREGECEGGRWNKHATVCNRDEREKEEAEQRKEKLEERGSNQGIAEISRAR